MKGLKHDTEPKTHQRGGPNQISMNVEQLREGKLNTGCKAVGTGPGILLSAPNGGARGFRDLGSNHEGKDWISGAEVIKIRSYKNTEQGGKRHCTDQLETASINVRHPNPTEEGSKTGPSQDPL